jgi:hypothetical protein
VKFEIEQCPECGEDADRIYEEQLGDYPLVRGGDDGPEDELNYDTDAGGNNGDFEGAYRDIDERVTLVCPRGHSWLTREPNLPPGRVRRSYNIAHVRISKALDLRLESGRSLREKLEGIARRGLGTEGTFDIRVERGCFVLRLKKEAT